MQDHPEGVVRHPARLAALRRLGLLNTEPEPAFDRLTALAARLLRVPVVLVSLVDAERQVFKSAVGLPEPWASRRETPLSHSFCQHVVASREPFTVADAPKHPLVRENLAIPDLGVIAYAGIPLITSDGHALGSFCAIDTVRHEWTEDEIAILRDLAAAVMTEIELRSEIAEHRLAERRLDVQYRVSHTLLEATRLDAIAEQLLQAIGEGLEWDFGAFWSVAHHAEELHCIAVWHTSSIMATVFADACRRLRFAAGVGLPGSTWIKGQPIWLADVLKAPNFPRLAFAAQAGLHSAFAFPIRGSSGFLGVIEFFNHAILEPDQELLQLIATLGNQIGQFMDRKRVEQAVREGEAHKAAIVEAALDSIITIDHRGRVLEFNPAAEQLFGYRRDEVLGQEMAELVIPPFLREGHRRGLARYLATGAGTLLGKRIEMTAMRADGSHIPVELTITYLPTGGPPAFTGFVRDISVRKRAEQTQVFLTQASTLLTSSLDYQTRIESLARLVVPLLADWCVVDIVEVDGTIQRVAVAHIDQAKEALLEELRRRYPPEWNSPQPAARALRSGSAQFLPEIDADIIAAHTHDGDHAALIQALALRSCIAVPLIARGQVRGAITVAFAESGRRYDTIDLALAEELARRAALAIDNARLYGEAHVAIRIRDEFLSIAAHELKTPLTSLLGNAQLLQRRAKREGTLGERDQRAVRVIVDQSNRLNKMIAALLDISRIERGQLSIERAPLDLCVLVQRVVAEIQPTLERHTIVITDPAVPMIVEGDMLRLEQVLQNLLQNAVKYSPPGRMVHVQLGQRDEMICIDVIDQGIGIPQAALPHLFQRFYRAPNVDPKNISGMGLGLYVVREIVTLHGGRVEVTSQEGRGSTFTICLPASRK
jgi:PAS domain S-box-containing protein